MSWTITAEAARAIGSQASSPQPRWPRMLIGGVLLWRALCVAAITDSADVLDSRFLGEWSSPGLNRSVRLTFTNYWDAGVPQTESRRAGISA